MPLDPVRGPAPASVDRRTVMVGSGFAVASTLLPAAAQAASPQGGSGGGTFSPAFSSLSTTATTLGTSVRTNNRWTFVLTATSGGTFDAAMWQFDPASLPSTDILRLSPRISVHTSAAPTSPADATAAVPNVGVLEPVDATYDAASARIVLTAPSPIVLAAGTTFWLQFYGTSSNVSTMFTEKTPDPWVSTVGTWSYDGAAGNPTYPFAPVFALGTFA